VRDARPSVRPHHDQIDPAVSGVLRNRPRARARTAPRCRRVPARTCIRRHPPPAVALHDARGASVPRAASRFAPQALR
jgi:hypothetical protein